MIFFDIDDTLIDSIRAHRLAIVELAGQQHLPIGDVAEAQRLWIAITDAYLDRFFRKEITAHEQRQRRLIDFWNIHGQALTSNEADRLYRIYHHHFLQHCLLFPDVHDALNKITHYRLGIISNGILADQQFKLDHNGIRSYFSPIVISEDVGSAKPDAAIFQLALDQASKSASSCYYIGNSYQLDYLGAKQAGLFSILIDKANEHPQVDDKHRRTSVIDAIDLILANPLATV